MIMKKLVFLFAVCLFSTASLFATTSKTQENDIKVEILSVNEDDKECNIRISGTYDGKKIDVTVTVEAENCAVAAGELLKAYAK
jgi:type 1 fimbria pilin